MVKNRCSFSILNGNRKQESSGNLRVLIRLNSVQFSRAIVRYIVQSCLWCIVTQTDKREAWSGKHVDTPEVCSAAQRGAARDRWLHGTAGVASLPADIPFVFRHWNVDDASPWHLYMLQYRADYTYRRLGVTHSASADSDSATGRRAAAPAAAVTSLRCAVQPTTRRSG